MTFNVCLYLHMHDTDIRCLRICICACMHVMYDSSYIIYIYIYICRYDTYMNGYQPSNIMTSTTMVERCGEHGISDGSIFAGYIRTIAAQVPPQLFRINSKLNLFHRWYLQTVLAISERVFFPCLSRDMLLFSSIPSGKPTSLLTMAMKRVDLPIKNVDFP